MMRSLILALVLVAGCGGTDSPHDGAGAADLGPFLCGNGNVYCSADEVCVSGDCVPACWYYDGGCPK